MRGRILGTLTGAAIAAVAACDLAPNAARQPVSFEISPNDTILKEGDTAQLRLLFHDAQGEPMEKPAWMPVAWYIEDDRFKEVVTVDSDGRLIANDGGKLHLVAYVGSWEAGVDLRISPERVLLTVPSFYLNQANQDPEGSVALVAGRDALLRVFLMGNGPSYFQPSVRAEFYQDGEEVYTTTIEAPVEELPVDVDQGQRDNSYNAIIPGHVLQPGVEMVIDIDPEGEVPTADGSVVRIPESGRMRLDVVGLKTHIQTLVPYHFTWRSDEANELPPMWHAAVSEDSSNMRTLQSWLPVGDLEANSHEVVYSDIELPGGGGWNRWLNENGALWSDEGEIGYYYGVANNFGGGTWGIAYLGRPHASVGFPYNRTFVHEVGHDMSLLHAPCGAVAGPDPNYPHDEADIGYWGWDPRDSTLVDASFKDFMGYCRGFDWVSDYNFERAMNYRVQTEGTQERRLLPPKEQTLILWGVVHEGSAELDPAFLMDMHPTDLPTIGPYTLTGLGPNGEERFSFGFTPMQVVDGEGATFFFALPYDAESDGTLERIEVSGPEGGDALTPGSEDFMAIVRDGEGGTIRAFLRDWDGNLPAGLDGAITPHVHLSDGIPGGAR